MAASFASILAPPGSPSGRVGAADPQVCRDLNLDQIIAGIVAARPDDAEARWYQAHGTDLATIEYRQAVMRDLIAHPVHQAVEGLAHALRAVRARIERSRQADYREEQERWFLAAGEAYCTAVEQAVTDFAQLDLRSDGLRRFADYLRDYAGGAAFSRLVTRVRQVAAGVDGVRFGLLLSENRITVQPDPGGEDFTTAIEATFARFRRQQAQDYRRPFADAERLNHIEAEIAACVAQLNPEVFRALTVFRVDFADFVDATLERFAHEVAFYLAYQAFIAPLEVAGLHFVLPTVATGPSGLDIADGFDLALAARQWARGRTVIPNTIHLDAAERLLVVTGPNQGGKTTLARAIGQIHYLAALGLPVPASRARLVAPDRIESHFDREEDAALRRGRLHDDLVRVRDILDRVTARSLVVLNELFASTTVHDALLLGRMVLAELAERGALVVCVTFLDELATFSSTTVSMVGDIDAVDPTVRTFAFHRRPPDGLAYALALAERHGVTRDAIRNRLRR